MKVGKFGYLNNFLPYYFLNGVEVVEATPKDMASKLLNGQIDYAPIPAFFYLSRKDLLRHYRFCVASFGKVLSVVVVSREKELDDGPIAITKDSMTSVSLLKIILRERGLRNRLVPMKTAIAQEMLERCRHALVIGDEAIKARMIYRVVMDLGEEWYDLTSLPMVFGISASLKNVDASNLDSRILESLNKAYENIESVLEDAEKTFKMPREFLIEYFRTLRFELGGKERRGLNEFEKYCRDCGLLR
ncbi:menaquinone biosynthetic enzyme MqnA/MqnD family protein [Archaeoglobus neptunius]|uniref:menaquinone biosynthetic enzyme MqnA/MqnD family protein n=1 Tax=Archaeoglobus neptunius TaxID=2798580 RepID=UPI001927B9AD|nr:menaquinone biosynthesis protein [Archaeoglobus neptunius]